jgi:hypothetical protein
MELPLEIKLNDFQEFFDFYKSVIKTKDYKRWSVTKNSNFEPKIYKQKRYNLYKNKILIVENEGYKEIIKVLKEKYNLTLTYEQVRLNNFGFSA